MKDFSPSTTIGFIEDIPITAGQIDRLFSGVDNFLSKELDILSTKDLDEVYEKLLVAVLESLYDISVKNNYEVDLIFDTDKFIKYKFYSTNPYYTEFLLIFTNKRLKKHKKFIQKYLINKI